MVTGGKSIVITAFMVKEDCFQCHARWCGSPANYSAMNSLGTTFGGNHFTAWLISRSPDFILPVPATGNSFTDTSVGSMWRRSPSLSRLSQPLWQNLAFFNDLYAYRTAEVFGCSWHVRNNWVYSHWLQLWSARHAKLMSQGNSLWPK